MDNKEKMELAALLMSKSIALSPVAQAKTGIGDYLIRVSDITKWAGINLFDEGDK